MSASERGRQGREAKSGGGVRAHCHQEEGVWLESSSEASEGGTRQEGGCGESTVALP